MILWLLACATGGPPAGDTAPRCGPPTLQIGPPGAPPFQAGDPVEVVWGGQGGLHADLAFEATGLHGRVLDVVATWTDGAEVWDAAERTVACAVDGCRTRCAAFRSLLVGRAGLDTACTLQGRPLTLAVRLGDAPDAAEAQVPLVAHVAGPSFVDPCP